MILAALLLVPPHEIPLAAFFAPCTQQETRSATVAEIAAAGEEWLQRCVTVSGRTSGRVLQAADSQDAMGLDNSEVLGIDFATEDDVAVTVTGRIDSCGRRERALEERRRRVPNAIILHAGYCHHRGGSVLVASQGSRTR